MAQQKNKIKQKIKISYTSKPEQMTAKEWQIKLRELAADKEIFAINSKGNGHYDVRNYNTANTYHVVWKGEGHVLNSCSCMDFKTSRLLTCKHLEAVKTYASKHVITRNFTDSPCLYIDYSNVPCLRLFETNDETAGQIMEYKSEIFGKNGSANPDNSNFWKIREFINEFKKTCPDFECTPDAMEYIDKMFDDHTRYLKFDSIFSNKQWWRNYLSKDIVPYPYQIEGMEFAARAGRCLVADEMGLGKTIQAIGTASLLYQEGFVSSVLVVCPTSLKYQWQKEILKFCGKEALVVEGNPMQRIKSYKDERLFKIVSYNALVNDLKLLKNMSVDMIIMDEVQRLKNWNTQIAKGVRRIHADYKVILSGTPLENKLEELYSIVQLVDQYILGPYYEFREKHISVDGSGRVTGYKNLNVIGENLGHLLLRRRKSDVALQLPERIDKNLFVPMTKEQMSVHDELKTNVARLIFKWKKMHYLSDTDRRRLLLSLSQMRMVCDSTFILDQESRYDTKVDEVINIISDIVNDEGNKVVIFSQWERMTRLIAEELGKKNIGYEYLYGGVSSVKRKQLMDSFNETPEIRVFISTDAGCTGLNLQTANTLINLDLPWNPAILEQRIGRIYRIGQRNNIHVINLISMGTIEEQMLAKLKFKSSMFAGALDGGDDEVLLEGNKLQEIADNFDFSDVKESQVSVLEDIHEETNNTDITEKEDSSIEPNGSHSENDIRKVTADEVIQKGISFVSELVEVLSDPESSKLMVDALVKEDEDTGKATINIPVKNKATVMQFVKLIGSLFGK